MTQTGMAKPPADAPQADRLDFVRRALEAIRTGASESAEVARVAQVAPRYALYCIQAARQLGFLVDSPGEHEALSDRGIRLLGTSSGSAEERQVFRDAMRESAVLGSLEPTVLGEAAPTVEAIAELLIGGQQMALTTALRRARTLLAWRRFVLRQDDPRQLSIEFETSDWAVDERSVSPGPPPTKADSETEGDEDRATSAESLPVPTPLATALPDLVEPPLSGVADIVSPIVARREESGDEAGSTLLKENDLAYLRRQVELKTFSSRRLA